MRAFIEISNCDESNVELPVLVSVCPTRDAWCRPNREDRHQYLTQKYYVKNSILLEGRSLLQSHGIATTMSILKSRELVNELGNEIAFFCIAKIDYPSKSVSTP